MSNLQEQVRKLIKYGNKKFNLNETNLRDIIDNASVGDGSGFGDYKVNSVIDDNGITQTLEIISENYTPSVTYGVKIDLANSNPETSVTYTDDSIGFDSSYMDFANDVFVYGSWQDKFPFNQVKPCILKDGVVSVYLNPNNYAEDIDGNPVDITSTCDGNVMIEIPKVYYRLHNDGNYQYVQISDKAQEGFCCLAHTYKGVEKDKIYIGAYDAYNSDSIARSVSGVTSTGGKNLSTWRNYCQANGLGYECFT